MCCKVEYNMYSLYSVILFDIIVVMGIATNLLAGSNHSNCCRSMAFREKNSVGLWAPSLVIMMISSMRKANNIRIIRVITIVMIMIIINIIMILIGYDPTNRAWGESTARIR